MALLQRLLLLPLLAPLLAVLLVAAINPRPAIALRLLTWTSPALPISLWLSLAACGGGALSAGATSLALRSATRPASPNQRRSRTAQDPGSWSVWPDWGTNADGPAHGDGPANADWHANGEGPSRAERSAGQGLPHPVRPPGEPAPTVAVPFRVIRKGSGSGRAPGAGPGSGATRGQGQAAPAEPRPQTVSVGDGWDEAISDDW